VSITSLKTTTTIDDLWFFNYRNNFGYGIEVHPNYKALKGDREPLEEWCKSLRINSKVWMRNLLDLLEDIKKNGIKEPIWIYKDYRINTGHKRVSIALFLGYTTIKAVIVPDDVKV
jgi:hypothetical protein